MKILRLVAAGLFMLGTLSLQAQKSDFGAWYMYFGNNKISKKLNLHNEIQYRNFDAEEIWNSFLSARESGMILRKTTIIYCLATDLFLAGPT